MAMRTYLLDLFQEAFVGGRYRVLNILLFTGCTYTAWYYVRLYFQKKKLPPGPWFLPIIECNTMFWFNRPGERCYRLWSKYGNVVAYKALTTWRVQLFGLETIKEAFVQNADHFSNRPMPIVFDFKGIALASDPDWKPLRKHALQVFRDQGVGRNQIHDKILIEKDYFVEWLNKHSEVLNSDDLFKLVSRVVSNIISQVVMNERFDYNDKSCNSILNINKYMAAAVLYRSVLFADYLPFDLLGFWKARAQFEDALTYFRARIEEHKRTFNAEDHRDYIDSCIAEMEHSEVFDDEHVLASIWQLYFAGSDTTSTSYMWTLLLLMKYPEVQDVLYEEIQSTIGNRNVSRDDRDKVPRTLSFISECLRFGEVAPMALPHLCDQDTIISGKTIPKGMIVLANLHSANHDEKTFPDSYSFKYDRFVDENGQFNKSLEKMIIPFSIGRRSCVGEMLARSELFVLVVSTVQHFKLKSTCNPSKLSLEARTNFLNHPPRYDVQFIPRAS